MKRKRLLTTAAGTLIAAAIAGVAWASIPGPGNVYSACMLKGLGTIRLIDKSLPSTNLMSHCTDKETEISWNQAGQPGSSGPQGAKGDPGAPGKDGANGTNGTDGKDGVSITTASEPAGANCTGGGVQLTATNDVSYVCNGKDGEAGRDGVDGANGTNGVDGADGQDGVSVTSAVEPAGTNCANGGSKFTAANGVTYACNGTNGSGSSGPGGKTIAGRVAADGTVMLGAGFSASHVGSGLYEVSFPAGTWSACPVATFTPRFEGGGLAIPAPSAFQCGSDGSGSITIHFFTIGNGILYAMDPQFDFIAVQP